MSSSLRKVRLFQWSALAGTDEAGLFQIWLLWWLDFETYFLNVTMKSEIGKKKQQYRCSDDTCANSLPAGLMVWACEVIDAKKKNR